MALAKTVSSYAELLQLLSVLQAPHRADPALQTIDLLTATDLPGPLHVRWEKHLPLVQLLQPVVVNVPAARVRDIEAAVVRINNAAVFSGLGFDHAMRRVYYRITGVVLLDGLRVDLLQAYLQGAVANATELRPSLLKVVDGLSGDEILGAMPVS